VIYVFSCICWGGKNSLTLVKVRGLRKTKGLRWVLRVRDSSGWACGSFLVGPLKLMDKDILQELKWFKFCGQNALGSRAFAYIPMGSTPAEL
jgi:hypothetical protein